MEEVPNPNSPIGLKCRISEFGSVDSGGGGDDRQAPVAEVSSSPSPDGKSLHVFPSSLKDDKEIVEIGLGYLVSDDEQSLSCSLNETKCSPDKPIADSPNVGVEETQEFEEEGGGLRGGVLRLQSPVDGSGEEMQERKRDSLSVSFVGIVGITVKQPVDGDLDDRIMEKPSGPKVLETTSWNFPENFEDDNSGFVVGSEKNGDGEKDSLPRSLEIKLIDDTAVIDILEFTKDSGMAGKKNRKEETDVKEKKPKRRSRNRKKISGGSKNLPNLKDSNGRKGRGKRVKKKNMYTRKEMEDLRYLNVKGQRKMWQGIYNGFSADVKKEYDELGKLSEQCQSSLKSLHRAPVLNNNGQGLLGIAAAGGGGNCVNFVVYKRAVHS